MDAAKISVIRGTSVFLTLSSNDAGKEPLDVQQGLQKVFGFRPGGRLGCGDGCGAGRWEASCGGRRSPCRRQGRQPKTHRDRHPLTWGGR